MIAYCPSKTISLQIAMQHKQKFMPLAGAKEKPRKVGESQLSQASEYKQSNKRRLLLAQAETLPTLVGATHHEVEYSLAIHEPRTVARQRYCSWLRCPVNS